MAKKTVNDFNCKYALKPILVQPFRVYDGLPNESGAPADVQIAIHGSALVIDACSIGEMLWACRKMHLWGQICSAGDGRLQFALPTLAIDRTFERIVDKPVFLALLDLRNQGWRSGTALAIEHKPGSLKLYCTDKLAASLLRVLASVDWFIRAGVGLASRRQGRRVLPVGPPV